MRHYIAEPKTSPVPGLLLSVLPGLVAAVISSFAVQAVFHRGAGMPWPTLVLFFVVFAAIGVTIPLIVVFAVRWNLASTEWAPSLVSRLPQFAADNGWVFSERDPNPAYPGGLFATGANRVAVDHIRSTSGRYFDFGDFCYEISGGESSATVRWGFIAIHLGRPLPHIVVEATLPGFPGWKPPFDLDRSQALSLEGDFDRYFTLYCPADYQRDALYIFAPDLMSLLLDTNGGSHVEIVDEWFFVYDPKSFEGYSAEDYRRLVSIIQVVGAKALRQTGKYVDHRAASVNGRLQVAQSGRRLRVSGRSRRLAVAVVVIGIVVGVLVAALPV